MTAGICSGCGRSFVCGSPSTGGNCWCDELPRILPPDPEMGCLCRECLIERTAERIESALHEKSHAEMLQLARPYAQSASLIENIDYTVENGNLVFSAWYHLKRGSCCGNACRHCPFPKESGL